MSGAVRRACYYQGNLFGFQRELYSLYESWRTSKNQKQFQLSAELSCSYGYPPFMSRFGTLFEYTQLELTMFNLIGSRLGEELEVQWPCWTIIGSGCLSRPYHSPCGWYFGVCTGLRENNWKASSPVTPAPLVCLSGWVIFDHRTQREVVIVIAVSSNGRPALA